MTSHNAFAARVAGPGLGEAVASRRIGAPAEAPGPILDNAQQMLSWR
ncbi:hypothetical protein ACIBO2_03865 [Nonomuraea sp. NPDC050022]